MYADEAQKGSKNIFLLTRLSQLQHNIALFNIKNRFKTFVLKKSLSIRPWHIFRLEPNKPKTSWIPAKCLRDNCNINFAGPIQSCKNEFSVFAKTA